MGHADFAAGGAGSSDGRMRKKETVNKHKPYRHRDEGKIAKIEKMREQKMVFAIFLLFWKLGLTIREKRKITQSTSLFFCYFENSKNRVGFS